MLLVESMIGIIVRVGDRIMGMMTPTEEQTEAILKRVSEYAEPMTKEDIYYRRMEALMMRTYSGERDRAEWIAEPRDNCSFVDIG